MKTSRLLTCAVLLFSLAAGGSALAATAAPAKKTTYAVVGYYYDVKPAPALVEKALLEVGAKMKNFAAVKDTEGPDRVVAVLFKGNSYRINFDAPTPEALQLKRDTMETYVRIREMEAASAVAENRDGHGRGK